MIRNGRRDKSSSLTWSATSRVPTGLAPAVGAVPTGFIYDKVSSTETVDVNASYAVPTDMFGGMIAVSPDAFHIFLDRLPAQR